MDKGTAHKDSETGFLLISACISHFYLRNKFVMISTNTTATILTTRAGISPS